jgi:hypothetical protein
VTPYDRRSAVGEIRDDTAGLAENSAAPSSIASTTTKRTPIRTPATTARDKASNSSTPHSPCPCNVLSDATGFAGRRDADQTLHGAFTAVLTAW